MFIFICINQQRWKYWKLEMEKHTVLIGSIAPLLLSPLAVVMAGEKNRLQEKKWEALEMAAHNLWRQSGNLWLADQDQNWNPQDPQKPKGPFEKAFILGAINDWRMGKISMDSSARVRMAVNLSEILKSTEMFRKKKDGKIGKKWLGKFEGAIPSDKTSTEYLKELRGTLYGKI